MSCLCCKKPASLATKSSIRNKSNELIDDGFMFSSDVQWSRTKACGLTLAKSIGCELLMIQSNNSILSKLAEDSNAEITWIRRESNSLAVADGMAKLASLDHLEISIVEHIPEPLVRLATLDKNSLFSSPVHVI
ncbi:hypothetical protein V6N13_005082 [Hibiscus sabdariffa]